MRFTVCFCFVLASAHAFADSIPARPVVPAESIFSVPQVVVPSHPRVDPAKELKGAELLKALRAGGLVLYMRHTDTGKVTPACTESNLSPRGEEQARQVGAALRALQIPFGRRESSELCRVRDAARFLDVGDFTPNPDLSNTPKREGHDFHSARMRLLAEKPAPKVNNLFVGHMQGGDNPGQYMYLEIGEVIVFRPDGKGGSDAIARVRMVDWSELVRLK